MVLLLRLGIFFFLLRDRVVELLLDGGRRAALLAVELLKLTAVSKVFHIVAVVIRLAGAAGRHLLDEAAWVPADVIDYLNRVTHFHFAARCWLHQEELALAAVATRYLERLSVLRPCLAHALVDHVIVGPHFHQVVRQDV